MYTVLAITCHPDDMEIHAAGTLMKCVERGDRVVVCHLCSGNLGHMVIQPDELAKIRSLEAQRSAAIGGFEYRYGGFDDLDIYDNNKKHFFLETFGDTAASNCNSPPIGTSGLRFFVFIAALRILSTSSPLPDPSVE